MADEKRAIAHAWLVNDAGEVIDPTWGDEVCGTTYFGVVFDKEYIIQIANITKRYGILENDFRNEHKLAIAGFPPHALHPRFHSRVTAVD